MTIKEYKIYFESQLSTLYSKGELYFLSSVFIEEKLKMNNVEQKISENINLKNEDLDYLKSVIVELKTGKPYQQILGYCDFFGMKYFVDENVLIPRPETEEVLEFAIEKLNSLERKNLKILDIGTGSGILPIVLKKHFPDAEVSAVDISEKALKIAQKNAAFHKTSINFIQKDYLQNTLEGEWDLIISNPPYIGINEKNEIDDSVKSFEPNIALFSPTPDALIFYRKIALDASLQLKEKGIIVLEINQKLGNETLDLYQSFSQKELIKDISGNDRIIFAQK